MIFCRSITASMLLVAMGSAGCVPTSAENGMQDSGTVVIDISSLPLVEHAGKISASEFIRLFQEVCLQNFPDSVSTGEAFVRRGFAVKNSALGIGEEYDKLFLKTSNLRKGIAGSFGQYPIFDYGEVDDCSLEAYVTEPDAVDIESVVSALAPGAWLQAGPGFYTFTRRSADGRQAEIKVYLPEADAEVAPNGEYFAERQKFRIGIQALHKY